MSVPTDTPTSVYLYYDRRDFLIYVGITGRGVSRNREHNADKEWWSFVARQEVEHFESRPKAAAREKDLIQKRRPPFNTVHNPYHADLRSAYLKLAAGEAQAAHVPTYQPKTKRRIILDFEARTNERTTWFRSRPEDRKIAARVHLPKAVTAASKQPAGRASVWKQHEDHGLLRIDGGGIADATGALVQLRTVIGRTDLPIERVYLITPSTPITYWMPEADDESELSRILLASGGAA